MQTIITLFQEMYELTHPECCKCRIPYSCCSPEYCEMAIEYAKEDWDIVLERTGHPNLPLMGPNGCVAAPHLRPLCTFHTCGINSLGTSGNQEWDQKYFDLRERIDDLMWEVKNGDC